MPTRKRMLDTGFRLQNSTLLWSESFGVRILRRLVTTPKRARDGPVTILIKLRGPLLSEMLKLIEIDFIDTLSTEKGEIEARPESASARREGVASLGAPSASHSTRMACAT